MSAPAITPVLLLLLLLTGFYLGRGRARSAGQAAALNSLPVHYGFYVALWCGVPGFLIFILWSVLEPEIVRAIVVADLPASARALPADKLGLLINDIRNIARGDVIGADNVSALVKQAAARYVALRQIGLLGLGGASIAAALAGLAFGLRKVAPGFRARNAVEKSLRIGLLLCSMVAILTTVGIVLSLLFETVRFFHKVPIPDFLFGLKWSPQTAIRADQVGSSGAFGAVPVLVGTLLITVIAMAVAVPVGLYSAIYLSEYARPRTRAVIKPLMEILAGIPTVIYGFFAALTVAPLVRDLGRDVGLDVTSESALAAGLVMGVMIIPFVSSLSDDVIAAVPQSLREGALGLGATRSETMRRVLLPAALPGIIGAVLLAISRAIGETMIVVMAAGLAARLTLNPLDTVTTVTVQIVTLLTGDQAFDSAKTLAAFALGLLLFLITLALNVVALRVVQKYREKYD